MKKRLLFLLLVLLALTGTALAAPYGDTDETTYYQTAPLSRAEDVAVTTGDARDVGAFSATLSMTARGSAIYRKAGKVFGFEYCVGGEPSEAEAQTYTHFWGGDVTPEELPGGPGFTYTGPIPCLPGRTYWYRGYFAFIDESTGEEWPVYVGEWRPFTTPGAGTLPQLRPGEAMDFTLVDGEPRIWSLTAEDSGFYSLALTEPSDAWRVELSLCAGGDKDWKSLRTGEPFFARAGEPLYLRAVLSYGSPLPASLAAAPFGMAELRPGKPLTVSSGGGYVRFTPEASGQYLLSLDVDGGGSVSLVPWNAGAGKWDYSLSVRSDIGAARMVVRAEAGETYYFRADPGYHASGALLARPYTPPEGGFAVRAGEARLSPQDPLTAVVPITVELPEGVVLWPGTEYRTADGRVSSMGGSGHGTGALLTWEGTMELAPVPGQEYFYRAYLEIRDQAGKPVRTYENGDETLWHSFRAPDPLPAQALRLDGPNPVVGDGWRLLSFTPEEAGLYVLTPTQSMSLKLWNPETARWSWSNESADAALASGETLYVQASGGEITVGRSRENAAVRANGKLIAAANAETPGTYVFAAYAAPGGAELDAVVRTGSGPLAAELSAGEAEAVKVFRLSGDFRPLAPPLELEIRDR